MHYFCVARESFKYLFIPHNRVMTQYNGADLQYIFPVEPKSMVVQKICFLKLLTPSKYLALEAIVTDHILCQKCRIPEKCKEIFKLSQKILQSAWHLHNSCMVAPTKHELNYIKEVVPLDNGRFRTFSKLRDNELYSCGFESCCYHLITRIKRCYFQTRGQNVFIFKLNCITNHGWKNRD